jgi:DNA ligase-1
MASVEVQTAKKFQDTMLDREPFLAEPKLDGIRCAVVYDVRMGRARSYSRGGNVQRNMELVLAEVETILARYDISGTRVLVDGEALVDGEWGLTSGLLRAERLQPKHLAAIQRLRLHVFDVVSIGMTSTPRSDVPQNVRTARVARLFGASARVIPVQHQLVRTRSELDAYYRSVLKNGFEGLILKRLDGGYAGGVRSSNWLKHKPFTTTDGTIIEFLPGNGKHAGRLGAIRVRLRDGRTVKVGTGFTDAQRTKIWRNRNKLVGKWLELRYQRDKREVAVARFPTFVRIRTDRDW